MITICSHMFEKYYFGKKIYYPLFSLIKDSLSLTILYILSLYPLKYNVTTQIMEIIIFILNAKILGIYIQ